jgi:hypothetical protein
LVVERMPGVREDFEEGENAEELLVAREVAGHGVDVKGCEASA